MTYFGENQPIIKGRIAHFLAEIYTIISAKKRIFSSEIRA